MEETHRKLVRDLKQQHQREVAALLQEKDHLLKEETAATVTGTVKLYNWYCTTVALTHHMLLSRKH